MIDDCGVSGCGEDACSTGAGVGVGAVGFGATHAASKPMAIRAAFSVFKRKRRSFR
jgi:hypothetical protein